MPFDPTALFLYSFPSISNLLAADATVAVAILDTEISKISDAPAILREDEPASGDSRAKYLDEMLKYTSMCAGYFRDHRDRIERTIAEAIQQVQVRLIDRVSYSYSSSFPSIHSFLLYIF